MRLLHDANVLVKAIKFAKRNPFLVFVFLWVELVIVQPKSHVARKTDFDVSHVYV